MYKVLHLFNWHYASIIFLKYSTCSPPSYIRPLPTKATPSDHNRYTEVVKKGLNISKEYMYGNSSQLHHSRILITPFIRPYFPCRI